MKIETNGDTAEIQLKAGINPKISPVLAVLVTMRSIRRGQHCDRVLSNDSN
jgi:hypothetical protein